MDTANFSIEKDFKIALSNELHGHILSHKNRVNKHFLEWKSTDADLIHEYKKNFDDFKKHFSNYIQWHIKIINDKQEVLYNEVFEVKMGVNV